MVDSIISECPICNDWIRHSHGREEVVIKVKGGKKFKEWAHSKCCVNERKAERNPDDTANRNRRRPEQETLRTVAPSDPDSFKLAPDVTDADIAFALDL